MLYKVQDFPKDILKWRLEKCLPFIPVCRLWKLTKNNVYYFDLIK